MPSPTTTTHKSSSPSSRSYTVAEGSSVSVKVSLNADPERTVTIPITKTNHGGGSAADYSGVPGTVAFDIGDTEESFTIMAEADMNDDRGESGITISDFS